jgi:low temperature requirement protein LtrA
MSIVDNTGQNKNSLTCLFILFNFLSIISLFLLVFEEDAISDK